MSETEKTAAREGFPVWRLGEIVTLRGVNFKIREIHIDDKVLVLQFHDKTTGIAAMVERLNGQHQNLKP